MLNNAKLSRRKALKLLFYSSISTLILPLNISCKNVSKNNSEILKSELDVEISKIPSIQINTSEDGLAKIPLSYIYKAGERSDYILISHLNDGEYTLRMYKLDVVKKEADFILVKGVEEYANILISPGETLKKLNQIDHLALKHKFLMK